MADPALALVQALGVTKRYGPLRALDCVDLTVRLGEVHALVGENGAGKSTLGRILGGAAKPDEGRLLIDGVQTVLGSPRDALQHGIVSIAQELALANELSVAENVYLGAEPSSWGLLRTRRLRAQFADLVDRTGFDLPPDSRVGGLRTAEKQQVEILRALARDARLIVMDEPSAALSGPDVDRLHRAIRELAAAGTAVVLVSHFLGEVLDLADTVTVLRDGAVVKSAPAREETHGSLIEAMLGRSLGTAFPARADRSDGPTVLEVSGLHAPGVAGVDLQVQAGEIVALAGLVGSGRTEVARAICGANPRHAGIVHVAGRPLGRTPAACLRAGVVMIAESRRDQGLLPLRPVTENVTLSRLRQISTAGVVVNGRERTVARDMLERVGVRGSAAPLAVGALSGGNQQKVLFGRALMCRPTLLIADEPTRGVDVGSKRAIYDLITSLAARGVGVLLISSELEEVLGLAHRVVVMRAGRVAAELTGTDMTEAAVLSAAFDDTHEGAKR